MSQWSFENIYFYDYNKFNEEKQLVLIILILKKYIDFYYYNKLY